jgi:hypothetical protein
MQIHDIHINICIVSLTHDYDCYRTHIYDVSDNKRAQLAAVILYVKVNSRYPC